MLRVLLIAPDVGLAADAEMELISGAFFSVTPLRGVVTQERIVRATSRDKFDVIHIAAHGSAAGIQISNDVLSKEQLGQIAKQVNCELVFLNACDSAHTAQYLADRGVPLVVANTNEVLDADALRTAAYFYGNVGEYGGDYRKAYERVNPRDGTLAIFAGAGYVDKVIQPIGTAIQRLPAGLDQLRQQLAGGQKSVMRVLAGAVAAMLLVNGLALWGIAGAATAQAQSPAELSRAINELPAGVRTGLITQLVEGVSQETLSQSPIATAVPVPRSPLPTVKPTKTREEEEEMATATETETQVPTETETETPIPSATSSLTPTPIPTETETETPIPTFTLMPTPTFTPTETETAMPTETRCE